MLKKVLVILLAIFVISCEQYASETQDLQTRVNSSTSVTSVDEETATPEKGLIDTIREAAFTWMLKLGLLFNKKTIYTIDYFEGYNLNFKITEDQARSLLPDNITPVAIKILENEPEAHYYISWYLAVMKNNDSATAINRVDLFTYGRDQNGELCLYFLSSVMEIPKFIGSSRFLLNRYKAAMEFFARDSQTGGPAYPHYFTKTLQADSNTFYVQYEDSFIETENCAPVATDDRFSLDFIMANSQIYRNAYDKNVNYFNQSFINAKVETRDINCFSYENLEGFHPMLEIENLKSIQFYGCKDRKITWYFEM